MKLELNYGAFSSEAQLVTHILSIDPLMTTQEILAHVYKFNPRSRITKKRVQQYKTHARNNGFDVPYKGKRGLDNGREESNNINTGSIKST